MHGNGGNGGNGLTVELVPAAAGTSAMVMTAGQPATVPGGKNGGHGEDAGSGVGALPLNGLNGGKGGGGERRRQYFGGRQRR